VKPGNDFEERGLEIFDSLSRKLLRGPEKTTKYHRVVAVMPKIVIATLPPPSPTNKYKLPALQLHRTNLSFYQIIFMSRIKLINHP
jgi:hypothetical protein